MGATVEDAAPGELVVTGTGLMGLQAPRVPLDCGSSRHDDAPAHGPAGRAARSPRSSSGNASLTRRPMMRVVGPLRARGADHRRDAPHPTLAGELLAPLFVGPLADGKELGPLEHRAPCRAPT